MVSLLVRAWASISEYGEGLRDHVSGHHTICWDAPPFHWAGSDQIAEVIYEDGNGQIAEAFGTKARAELQLFKILIEVDEGHTAPRRDANRFTLETRDEPAEVRLVVRCCHPSRMLGGNEHEDDAGRGFGVPHIDWLPVDVRIELDPAPAEGHWLKAVNP